MDEQEPNLRIRVNQIDYIVEPAGPLDNTALPKAPVVRIYGDSSVGKKACLHVHEVYPYFFIDYDGQTNPESGKSLITDRITLELKTIPSK